MMNQQATVMRKSDKATKTSHNFNQNGQNVITSNRFQIKNGSNNGKHSFFGARRQTLTNQSSASSSGYHPHHHGEFHRNNQKNAVSSGTFHKKWNNKNSVEESVISASSCTNSNSTNNINQAGGNQNHVNHAVYQQGNNVNKKMKSADSHGYHSSRTSGHASRSKDSFDMDDMKNEVNKMQNLPHITIDEEKAAEQSVQSLESLQQIQEAKPGNKRALIVDLPPYLYSIPALASFFEPYGEVAMLQILPQKRMWDADLIDLLGASMCNRLANQSLCAIVEFYSARMAKFIIGILRKRLPILKFRCALLKPSAAIELSNQAENLGLQGVVVMKNKPAAKQTISSDSCRDTGSNESEDHDHHMHLEESHQHDANGPRQSVEFESGCEDVSSSENHVMNNNNDQNVNNAQNSNAQRLPSYASLTESEHNNDTVQTPTPRPDNNNGQQRFTTSFQITLGR